MNMTVACVTAEKGESSDENFVLISSSELSVMIAK